MTITWTALSAKKMNAIMVVSFSLSFLETYSVCLKTKQKIAK